MSYPPSLSDLGIPDGQLVAWSYSTNFSYNNSSGNPTITGSALSTSGSMTVGSGWLGSGLATCNWTGFPTPTLPSGSTITAIKAVVVATNTTGTGGSVGGLTGPIWSDSGMTRPFTGTLVVGSNLGTNPSGTLSSGGNLFSQSFGANIGDSLSGTGPVNTSVGFDFVAMAIIYTPPPRPKIETWINVSNTRPVF